MGVKKAFRGISHKQKKFGHGVTKRLDSVGKFSGDIIKKETDTIDGAISNLSNPMVIIGVVIVGGIIAVKFL